MSRFTAKDLLRIRILWILGVATVLALLVRLALRDLNPDSYFHPHGYCYLWQPDLVAAHVISDGLIGLAYISISLTLLYLVRRARRHLPFSWVFVAFGAFIIACGATHLMEIWTLWTPVFWLSADIKIITAVASVTTAVVLPPLIPKVLQVMEEARLSELRRLDLQAAHAELERRVEERTAELSAALARAEEANRAKEAFLGTVSHELRTPLNAIVGWSRMLATSHEDDAFVRRGIEVIERNARVQTQLVEDLLDVARVSAGTIRLHLEPVDLVRVVSHALDVVRPMAAGRRVAVGVSGPEHLTLQGDERRLQQVVWNLLSNAVKFTPPGGSIHVTVDRDAETGEATLEVRDTGIGIDPGFMPHLFDRFTQADPTSTRVHQGLGLGLAISRHLVELHGGSIAASSAGPGTGATFRVSLPIGTVTRAPLDVRGMDDHASGRLDGVRVLLVDDDADARETFSLALARAGASVRTADSSDTALRVLDHHRFDVLLSDLAMPYRDGYELIGEVRRSNRADVRQLPAIALSAFVQDEYRDRALGAGFQLYLAKPLTPEDLVAAVRGLTAR